MWLTCTRPLSAPLCLGGCNVAISCAMVCCWRCPPVLSPLCAHEIAQCAVLARQASLPAPVTKLPRSLPLPAPKALTRWEQYAKEKGIVKRKRDRMVFDEEMQDFRPRYGFGVCDGMARDGRLHHDALPRLTVLLLFVCCVQRANDEMRDWVIDVKPGTDPMVDPFEARANAKKERIVKNKLSHIRNLVRARQQAMLL